MALIQEVNRAGTTIMVIEHVMKAIMGISNRIMVLHHGQKIAEGAPAEISGNPQVIAAYLGERYSRKVEDKPPCLASGTSTPGMVWSRCCGKSTWR